MKKAFTLVELLGVIVLLGIITLLILPPFLNSIDKNKESVNEATKKIIYSATDLYISNNTSAFPKSEGNIYCITMSSLMSEGLLDEKIYEAEIKDKVDSSTVIKVDVKNNVYQKKLVEADKCNTFTKEPVINIALQNIKGEDYVVIDTYGMDSITSVRTSDGKELPKNTQNLKIYVNGFAADWNDATDYPTILNKNGYHNYKIEYGNYPTVEYLVNNNYNVFVNNNYVWGVSSIVNDYFDAGINLITLGNDTSDISILSSAVGSSTPSTFSPKVDNNFTKRIGNLSGSTSDSRAVIKFIPGTQILYSEQVGSDEYDAIGYYMKDNTKWIHSQIAIDNIEQFLIGSLNYISNKDLYYYKVTDHGTYNFTIYYDEGATKEISVTY